MSALRFRFYTTSKKAWSAMLAAIALAKESVFLEMYIFEEDTRGYDFVAELSRKAKEGVKVVLILDALGSFGLEEASVDRLRVAGVEVLFFSHFWKRTHRKILIVDEYTVFVGGVNISGQFAPWRDLQMRLSGKRFAKSALASFMRVYRDLGGRDPILRERAFPRVIERTKLWFIEHGIRPKQNDLRKYYEEHIASAQQSITLVTPYFIPRRWLIALLHDALLRGVRITIIAPRHVDIIFGDRVNYRYLSMFEKLGARCLTSRTMNHAKAMLIDDKEAIIGSQNLDALSFERNVEGGAFFDDKHMVAQLADIVKEWEREAQPLANVPRFRWYDVIISLLLPFFESIL